MQRNYNIRDYKFALAFFSVAVAAFGVYVIGSARESYQIRQLIGLGIGIFMMTAISLVDYNFILRFYWIYYVFSIVLLTAVRFFGVKHGGARRWFVFSGIQFQPSELVKFLLILFFAQFIMVHKSDMRKARGILSCVLLILPPFYLIYRQPDLSTSLMFLLIFASMMYVGGISYKLVLGVLAAGIPAAVVIFMLILQPEQKLVKGYQVNRILAWLQPEKYSTTEGYQQQNSIIAIGSGQLTGKGYKNNEVGSVKNGNFISEPQTDFIFAIVGEEMGFIGCMAVLILIGLVLIQIISTGLSAYDLAGALICAGVAAHIGFQTFFNIGVTTGLLPNTGIPLPFVSYGMTSLISLFMELGMVLNVGLGRSRDIARF